MSRAELNDCDDFPGQLDLYRANTERALSGKRGQAVLMELEAALIALPQKRLIRDAFECDGEVCAISALALKRQTEAGKPPEEALKGVADFLGGDYADADLVAARLKTSYNLAWEVMFLNDDRNGWDDKRTPEQRYEQMLAWVRENIRPAAGDGPPQTREAKP